LPGNSLTWVLIIAATLAALVLLRRFKKPKYLACAEYLVYLPGVEMPTQETIMDRVLKGNPYDQPVTPRIGLLFSDIRLHIALILRSRNPHIFRPDIFEAHVNPTETILDGLSESHSAVKVRYLSEEPLPEDKRHLQLLPYLAEAVAVLGSGSVIFDSSAERLFTLEELQSRLRADRDATGADMHLHVFSDHPAGGGIRVESRGLVKIGLPEFRTKLLEADMRVLAVSVMEEAARQVWKHGEYPEEVEVEAFGDIFRVGFDPKYHPVEVRILRKQTI
jgi:hypothetical protein